VSKPRNIDLVYLSRRSPRRFLKAIFDGLIYDGFRFPTWGSDGCIGNFCISKALVVTIPDADDRLALHLNFGCTPGRYTPGSLNLRITHFHLTARARRSQLLINDAGPSRITASASIHINRNGTWGRRDNCRALAGTLGHLAK